MKIIKEGTIQIQPDGEILVRHFHIEGADMTELMELAKERVTRAYMLMSLRSTHVVNNDFTKSEGQP